MGMGFSFRIVDAAALCPAAFGKSAKNRRIVKAAGGRLRP
jgi:hypothetical protein